MNHKPQKLHAQLVYQQFLLERIFTHQILNAPNPQQALDETHEKIRSFSQVRTAACATAPMGNDAEKMLTDITERFYERLKQQVSTHQHRPAN